LTSTEDRLDDFTYLVVGVSSSLHIHRIIPHISIKIHLIFIAHRIRLQKPPQPRRIDPRFVIEQPQFLQPDLPRITKPVDIGIPWYAVSIVCQAVQHRTRVAAVRDNTTLVVRMQKAAIGGANQVAVVLHPGFIHLVTVNVAAGQCASAIVFGDQRIAVVEKLGFRARNRRFEQPAQGVVFNSGSDGTGGARQAVLIIVLITNPFTRQQIAIGIVINSLTGNLDVLVEAVRHVAAGAQLVAKALFKTAPTTHKNCVDTFSQWTQGVKCAASAA
jgi:hypothetical protein